MAVADELCDRVAFIVDGEIVLIDTPRELKLRHGQFSVRVEYRDQGPLQHRDFPLEGLGENPDFVALLQQHEI